LFLFPPGRIFGKSVHRLALVASFSASPERAAIFGFRFSFKRRIPPTETDSGLDLYRPVDLFILTSFFGVAVGFWSPA
jgi:hypothetical protein